MSLENGLPTDSALSVDEAGVVRVGKSRVGFDLVVEQYDSGMTPEDIVRAYDTLELADVNAAIAYYQRHRDEVHAYLKQRADAAQTLRLKIERDRSSITREELLARTAREKADAPIGK